MRSFKLKAVPVAAAMRFVIMAGGSTDAVLVSNTVYSATELTYTNDVSASDLL